MKKALRDLSPEEQQQMPYEELCAARRRAYREIVSGMSFPPEVHAWAERMQELHGPIVKVWANHVSWLEAFMIVRYGEEPAHWPEKLTDGDIARAQHWESRAASSVRVLSKERSILMAQLRDIEEKE